MVGKSRLYKESLFCLLDKKNKIYAEVIYGDKIGYFTKKGKGKYYDTIK